METIVPHEIEPEIAAPPPRRTRLPWRTQGLLLLAWLLSALLLVGGARALVEASHLVWAATMGQSVIAHVTAIDAAPVKAGSAGALTGVHFSYVDPLTNHRVERFCAVLPDSGADTAPLGMPPGPVQASAPPTIKVGDALPLRIVGHTGKEQVYVWTTPPGGRVLFLLLCGLAVIAVSVRLMVILLRWQRLRMRLLRHGQAVVGTIVHKHSDLNETPRYFLRYGYAGALAVPREHEEQVSLEQWKAFEIGQPVTVLYDEGDPATAGLYALIH